MPITKAAIIGALAFAGTFALLLAGFGSGPAATPAADLPAALPLADRPKATATTVVPEQLKEAKAATATKAAEPKALFQPVAEEKPRTANPKPAPVPVRSAG